MMTDKVVIELCDVSYTYEKRTEPAIREISFSVKQGEWISIVGPGGSGKTTLCGLLCGILQSYPGGLLQGKLQIDGQDMSEATAGHLAGIVGAAFQDPDTGLIQEYVEDELAFGPENLLFTHDDIEKRIHDSLMAVNLPEARMRRTDELSGGQKQRISIASVLAMNPKIFIFDDASANLDAPAAEKLITTMRKLHQQGHTLISATSRLDNAATADRVIILEEGRLIAEGIRTELTSNYRDKLVHLGCLPDEEANSIIPIEKDQKTPSLNPLLQVKQLCFGYPSKQKKENKTILKDVNVELYKNDILAVTGPNGSGKTTFGKLLIGLLPPPKNSIWIQGSDVTGYSNHEIAQTVGYVFQNPEHQFVTDTVWDECIFGLRMRNDSKSYDTLGKEWLRRFGLYASRSLNPYQLSSADKQLLNLASVLILQPDLIILDEPTAGLDYANTDLFMSYCTDYASQGKAVVLITHDTYATRRWSTKELAM
jgi:energy-coupling factor transporter ATP-binding protein EcfA2